METNSGGEWPPAETVLVEAARRWLLEHPANDPGDYSSLANGFLQAAEQAYVQVRDS